MNENLVNFEQVISNTIGRIRVEDARQAVTLESEWKKILLRLKTINPHEGENLASHTSIKDLKNGILLVEADHQGWMQILQFHKNYILKGMQMSFPGMNIKTIAMKLKGTKGELAYIEESNQQVAKQRMEQRMEEEEKINRNMGISEIQENSVKKSKLPQEIQSIFDDLRKSVLTNSK